MRYALLVVMAVFCGCATDQVSPTKEEWAQAEAQDAFGPRPENIEAILRPHWRITLFDADSMKDLEIREPVRSFHATWHYGYAQIRYRDSITYCWMVRCVFNAKNRYGGYTGLKAHDYHIRDGKLLAYE